MNNSNDNNNPLEDGNNIFKRNTNTNRINNAFNNEGGWGAIFSILLPGLGQIVQRRFKTGTWFLILFLLSAAVPGYSLFCVIQRFPNELLLSPVPTLPLLILPLLVLFSAVFDAAASCCSPKRSALGVRIKPPAKDPDLTGDLTPSSQIILAKLTAIFILSYLFLALLLPCLNMARESALRSKCVYHLKQIGMALSAYHDAYDSFPPVFTVDKKGRPLQSWRVLILPFIDSQTTNENTKDLYDRIKLDEPWNSEHNRQFHEKIPAVYQCPGNQIKGPIKFLSKKYPFSDRLLNCSYSAVVGENTMFSPNGPVRQKDLKKGAACCAAAVERIFPVCWMDPENEINLNTALEGVNVNPLGIGSGHPGGCNILMSDGSVRFISHTIDPKILSALLTISNE